LRDDVGKTAVMLCSLLSSRNPNWWNGVVEQNSRLFRDLWKSVVRPDENGISHLFYLFQSLEQGNRKTVLYRFNSKSEEIRGYSQIATILGKPNQEWCLRVIP